MREELFQVPAGVDGLRLWSEREQDAGLTAVETDLVVAGISSVGCSEGLAREATARMRCTCREFDGGGACLYLSIDREAERKLAIRSPAPAMAWVNWVRPTAGPLGVSLTDGMRLLDLWSLTGDAWSVESCRALLSAKRSEVRIVTRGVGESVPRVLFPGT